MEGKKRKRSWAFSIRRKLFVKEWVKKKNAGALWALHWWLGWLIWLALIAGCVTRWMDISMKRLRFLMFLMERAYRCFIVRRLKVKVLDCCKTLYKITLHWGISQFTSFLNVDFHSCEIFGLRNFPTSSSSEKFGQTFFNQLELVKSLDLRMDSLLATCTPIEAANEMRAEFKRLRGQNGVPLDLG